MFIRFIGNAELVVLGGNVENYVPCKTFRWPYPPRKTQPLGNASTIIKFSKYGTGIVNQRECGDRLACRGSSAVHNGKVNDEETVAGDARIGPLTHSHKVLRFVHVINERPDLRPFANLEISYHPLGCAGALTTGQKHQTRPK